MARAVVCAGRRKFQQGGARIEKYCVYLFDLVIVQVLGDGFLHARTRGGCAKKPKTTKRKNTTNERFFHLSVPAALPSSLPPSHMTDATTTKAEPMAEDVRVWWRGGTLLFSARPLMRWRPLSSNAPLAAPHSWALTWVLPSSFTRRTVIECVDVFNFF